MAQISTVPTKDGIKWYFEQRGSGPHLILIPSGEGDCTPFTKVAERLAESFTVSTFDMPGMSRTTAPPSLVHEVTGALLADQIVGLMDAVGIDSAAFYGCSSGAITALSLVSNHPDRVSSAIIHEAPLALGQDNQDRSPLLGLDPAMDDAKIIEQCREIYATVFNENREAWDALGTEYHARLDKNYVPWVRNYIGSLTKEPLSEEKIKQRPLFWTVGALTPCGAVFDNILMACKVGVPVGLLPCLHFPQVSIPLILADHISSVISRQKS